MFFTTCSEKISAVFKNDSMAEQSLATFMRSAVFLGFRTEPTGCCWVAIYPSHLEWHPFFLVCTARISRHASAESSRTVCVRIGLRKATMVFIMLWQGLSLSIGVLTFFMCVLTRQDDLLTNGLLPLTVGVIFFSACEMGLRSIMQRYSSVIMSVRAAAQPCLMSH